MKTTLLTAAFSVLALAANAGAPSAAKVPAAPAPAPEAFSYNFIEAGWTHVFPDQLDDLDGYYGHISYSPVSNVFLFAEWNQSFGSESINVWGDHYSVDYDYSTLDLGAGVYLPLCSSVDFVVTAAALRAEIDTDFGGEDEWGFDASVGFRVRVLSNLELGAFYGLTLLDDADIHSASVGAVYSLTESVDLTVRASFSDDEDQELGVGIRYNF